MTFKYQILGMTCTSCEAKVKSSLMSVKNTIDVIVSKANNSAEVTVVEQIPIETFQNALDQKYKIVAFENRISDMDQQSTRSNSFLWSDLMIWKRAGFNTLNCLVGCSIGDFCMVIFLQYYYPDTTMAIQMVLAIIAGLITSIGLETMLLHQREKLIWMLAFKTAIGMSFLSMVGMEIAMNTTDFMLTGGKMPMSDPNYWFAFIPSAIAGFLVPLPYNYYQLKKHNKACH